VGNGANGNDGVFSELFTSFGRAFSKLDPYRASGLADVRVWKASGNSRGRPLDDVALIETARGVEDLCASLAILGFGDENFEEGYGGLVDGVIAALGARSPPLLVRADGVKISVLALLSYAARSIKTARAISEGESASHVAPILMAARGLQSPAAALLFSRRVWDGLAARESAVSAFCIIAVTV